MAKWWNVWSHIGKYNVLKAALVWWRVEIHGVHSLLVATHRSVVCHWSHRWLVGEPEQREAQPNLLPRVHLPVMPENLISTQPNFKQTKHLQWCPDISPGSVQPVNGTKRGVGHKTVHLPLGWMWLKWFHFFALFNAYRQCRYKETLVRRKCLQGHDSPRFVSIFLSFMKYFRHLNRSTGHQQHAVGLSMVNAIILYFLSF